MNALDRLLLLFLILPLACHGAVLSYGLVSLNGQGDMPVSDWDAVGRGDRLYIAPFDAVEPSGVTVSGGSSKTVFRAYVGRSGSYQGNLDVVGENSYFATIDSMYIGYGNAGGRLNVSDGAHVHSGEHALIGAFGVGSVVVDNATFSTVGGLSMNRAGCSLRIVNGGRVSVGYYFGMGNGDSGVIDIVDGSLAVDFLSNQNGNSLSISLGSGGALALENSNGTEGVSEFMAVNRGTIELLVWNGSRYRPYQDLVEGVDYLVQPGTGELVGYGVLTSLHPVPEQSAFAMIFGLMGLVIAMLRRKRCSGEK